jgi:hypothetical protein
MPVIFIRRSSHCSENVSPMNSTTAAAANATPWSAIQACTEGSPDDVMAAIAAAPTGFAFPARCSLAALTRSGFGLCAESARSIVSAFSTICSRASAALAWSTENSGAGSNPRCRTTSRSQVLGMTQVSSSTTGSGLAATPVGCAAARAAVGWEGAGWAAAGA